MAIEHDADEISYTQAGTSPQQRTVEASLREVISISDFLNGSDARTALVNAIAEATARGGGTILVPSRSTSYDVDGAPIRIVSDNIRIVGQGQGSVIKNTSTTGSDLFSLGPAASGLTVAVNVSGGVATYTRTAGSFLADGFAEGQYVTWSGFSTAGNNGSLNGTRQISDLTATVMTVEPIDNLATETPGSGDEAVTAATLLQNLVFADMKIQSEGSAGHIFTFADGGIGRGLFSNLWLNQLNPAKSIMYGDFTAPSNGGKGLFMTRFVGGNYAHGTSSSAPSEVAFDLRSLNNRLTCNVWEDLKLDLNESTKPFFELDNSGTSAFCVDNVFRKMQVEVPRRGFISLLGCHGTVIDDVSLFDVDADIDGHLIEAATGAGGQGCEQTAISNIHRVSGSLAAQAGSSVSVSSLIGNGTTATATTGSAHGFGVNQRIHIAGATPSGFEGRFTILTKTSNTFTYECTENTTASGTITAHAGAMDIKIDALHTLVQHVGGTQPVINEVDLGDNGAVVIGDNARVNYFRTANASIVGNSSKATAITAVNTPLCQRS